MYQSKMDNKKKHRKVLRTAFTKGARELEQHLATPDVETRLLKVSLKLLEQKMDAIKVVDEELYSLLLEEDVSEQELLTEMETRDTYWMKFNELSLRCEEVIERQSTVREDVDSAQSVQSEGNSVSGTGRRKFRLPVLELKKFDGNIRDWLPFWSQFEKLHNDPDIDLSDKVEYLIQATVPNSKARQLVESFPATGANYVNIIEAFRARFGREDLLIELYVRELLKLIISNATSGTVIELYSLYDKIESQLRALETLGITSDKYAAMLFPLIESCFPPDLLRVWQRMPAKFGSQGQANDVGKLEDRLKSLMSFLKNEVENEQRVSLAMEGFGLREKSAAKPIRRGITGHGGKKRFQEGFEDHVHTAAGLLNSNVTRCLFCKGDHETSSCFKAQNFDLMEKKRILSENGACFRCLKPGHLSLKCHKKLRCIVCHRSHANLMCPDLAVNKRKQDDNQDHREPQIDQALTNNSTSHVFLQTLRVELKGVSRSRLVRALIDTGSQNSYILKSTAYTLGYTCKRYVRLLHGLFGGNNLEQRHGCYDIKMSYGNFCYTCEVLDQTAICSDISPIFHGPWTQELDSLDIKLSDVHDGAPIELLIGADIAGKLYTGKRKVLVCGLVAVETLLGWTLMGKIPSNHDSNKTTCAISLFVKNASITDLWELEALGITDPYEKKSKEELALATKEHFLKNVRQDSEGRYEIVLPWLEGHPPLPSNYRIAKNRLENTVKRLEQRSLLTPYNEVFQEWCDDHIIEEVPENELPRTIHYLPHRPVVKEGSATTKIRPVFDASAREKGGPSLNQCLEKGPNLIELIPAILIRFRLNKIGVISDIRRAFLQIGVQETDRNWLCFLWTDSEGHEKVYRHRRVVFGVNSSPFLLGATVQYHLSECLKKKESDPEHVLYSSNTVTKLSRSFYVDNCVTSLTCEEELDTFIRESVVIMSKGKFDLRGWEFTGQPTGENPSSNDTNVLGLLWDKTDDTLSVNREGLMSEVEEFAEYPVTKRLILSVAQRVFDPVGYTCPATLLPKLLLQQTWESKLSWDSPVNPLIESSFRDWVKNLSYLCDIKIPRWVNADQEGRQEWTIHTFCDASKDAFSAAVFLRVLRYGKVSIHLLAAKSRIAPLRTLSIPRLELMAAVIAVRLYNTVVENLEVEIDSYFWTDSTTILSWIQRSEEWAVFVWNRVKEIRETTSVDDWHHVPGIMNPADLPSRGCNARELLESRWWEGPDWLYEESTRWPTGGHSYNEEEINRERRKKPTTSLINIEEIMDLDGWHLKFFSSYLKILRMCAWINRFIYNCRNPDSKRQGELTTEEIDRAEMFVLRLIQRESFIDESHDKLRGLTVFKDNNGLIRLKSRICNRLDSEHFRLPIVLPSKNDIIERLIFYMHIKSCHVNVQSLMSILREKYWILGGRRTIKKAISKCIVCKRQHVKPLGLSAPPLPLDRVRDAVAFEIAGVDFAGPLFLKSGKKAWVCLFTCAVYRAVHLELCTSLSVANFMLALRRFIARRGRPKTMYSDNGTNFVGTENAFGRVDFAKIMEYSSAERIKWRFNPPAAPWWGGFWERLVGILKQLLRKVLGRAFLFYEDLYTVLCDCESVINSRPLTSISSEADDLVPLTPAMFLRDLVECGVPDCDAVDTSVNYFKRIRHRQKLVEDLRRRFRSEYLGQLKLFHKKDSGRAISLGEIVLVGNDQQKRIYWPIGRVSELLPGKDGQIRLVRITTAKGQLLRPIQRVYPLEVASTELQYPQGQASENCDPLCRSAGLIEGNEQSIETNRLGDVAIAGVKKSRAPEPRIVITRSGRVSKRPERFLS